MSFFLCLFFYPNNLVFYLNAKKKLKKCTFSKMSLFETPSEKTPQKCAKRGLYIY